MVSFAMTIKKSQGQSLAHVGLYLSNPIFSHGQLYVALSMHGVNEFKEDEEKVFKYAMKIKCNKC